MSRTGFVKSLVSPDPNRIPSFVFGSIAFGIFVGIITDRLLENSIWLSLVVIAGCLLLAAFFWYNQFTTRMSIGEGDSLGKYKVLITPVSTPGIIDTLIQHHGKTLKHVWLISNFADEPYYHFHKHELPELKKKHDLNFESHYQHYPDHIESNLVSAYNATIRCVEDAMNHYDINPEDMIVDITSGTKETTAGVVLACVENGWSMSYVRSEYEWNDSEKKSYRISGSEKILRVDVNYKTTKESPVSQQITNSQIK